MSEAPERIETFKTYGTGRMVVDPADHKGKPTVEYVRADLYAAAQEKIRALDAKLAKTVQAVASLDDMPAPVDGDGSSYSDGWNAARASALDCLSCVVDLPAAWQGAGVWEALADAASIGIGFVHVPPDGTAHRLDPKDVFVQPKELECAQRLAKYMAATFYPESPGWEVGNSMLLVIDQIDNMVTGLKRSDD